VRISNVISAIVSGRRWITLTINRVTVRDRFSAYNFLPCLDFPGRYDQPGKHVCQAEAGQNFFLFLSRAFRYIVREGLELTICGIIRSVGVSPCGFANR